MLLDDPIDPDILSQRSDQSKLVMEREALRKCLTEHIVLITFLSHCLTNLAEVGVLRRCLKDIYSLAVWRHLQPQRLEKELKTCPPRYRKLMNKLERNTAALDPNESAKLVKLRAFAALFIDKFLAVLERASDTMVRNQYIFIYSLIHTG